MALTAELGPIIEEGPEPPFKSPTKFRPLTVTSDVDPQFVKYLVGIV